MLDEVEYKRFWSPEGNPEMWEDKPDGYMDDAEWFAFKSDEYGATLSDEDNLERDASGGYTIFPDGTILQWGSFLAHERNRPTVYFPIAFPNAVCSITGAVTNVGNTNETFIIENNTITTTSFCGICGNVYYDTPAYYMAIGY